LQGNGAFEATNDRKSAAPGSKLDKIDAKKTNVEKVHT
jgi:hypothetical protein